MNFTVPVNPTCELPEMVTTDRMGRFYHEGRKEDSRTFSFQIAGMQSHQILEANQTTAQNSWHWHDSKKDPVIK